MRQWQLRTATRLLRAGGVVAYPTEAVYGLGCDPLDPAAVHALLALKGRAVEKGLILIAAEPGQLAPFILPLNPELAARVQGSWPGPVTWLLPARPGVPRWLRGAHASIAVRVTAHTGAAALCRAFGGALVSTSANPAGLPPARDPLTVRRYFGSRVDYVLHGPLGAQRQPTEIRDALTGAVVRPG